MKFLLIKYLITALIVVAVSEIAKRYNRLGALIASLPLISIMIMVWLHVEKQGVERIGQHAYYTFWYVLPTLPMFLLMPFMLGKAVNFWMSLLACILLTLLCFVVVVFVAKRLGVTLLP